LGSSDPETHRANVTSVDRLRYSPAETNPATFAGYLPEALANGTYKVAPAPETVPTKGLEGIQEALDILKKGVSAKKLVTLAN
jgi:hypothetical protein